MRSFCIFGLFAVAAGALSGQPINGPVYWSTTAPDCTDVEGPVAITNAAGATIGYSCYVSGTFVWLAAGGNGTGSAWSTSIRVGAPATNPVGVDYTFYDQSGNNLPLDTNLGSGSPTSSGNDVNFALAANQPAVVNLLGATGNTGYTTLEDGSVYAVFYCPDAITCGNVLPQLIYSALPEFPWSLSVPIAWDFDVWTQWSAEAIDDHVTGGPHVVSFVVYNESTTATTYKIDIYNSAGTLVGTGTTPSIPGFQSFGGGNYGEAGTYAAVLSQVITTPLPSGVFKVLFDGGSEYSAVEVLQIDGTSATTLQVAYDTSPTATAAVSAQARPAKVKNMRVTSTPKPVFKALPQ